MNTPAPLLSFTDERFHSSLWEIVGKPLLTGAKIYGAAILLSLLVPILLRSGWGFGAVFFMVILGWIPALLVALALIVMRSYESVTFAVVYREVPEGLEVTANGERMALIRRGQPCRVEVRVTPDEYLAGTGQSAAKGITFSRDIWANVAGQAVLLSRSRMGPDEAAARQHQIQAVIDTFNGTAAVAASPFQTTPGFAL